MVARMPDHRELHEPPTLRPNTTDVGRSSSPVVALFAIFLWFVPEMTFSLWWKVMVAALLAASVVCIVLFQVWLGARPRPPRVG